MSDVADMLGMTQASPRVMSAGEEAAKLLQDKPKVVDKKAKKPKGMKREVFDLIAKDGIPPVVQTSSNPVFKSKRALTNEGKWVWTAIESSARPDNLRAMHHWIRADKYYPDYPYAQFNVKVERLVFSDEQYETNFFESGWTKADTEVLLTCANDYDLRWPIICDRIELSSPKSSEELQARYFSIANTFQRLEAAKVAAPFGNSTQNVKVAHYDFDKEVVRRKRQDQLYYRTKDDEKDEIRIREELKSINEQLKKMKKTIKTSAREAALSAASSNANDQPILPPIKAEDAGTAVLNDPASVSQYLAEGKAVLEASVTNPIEPQDNNATSAAATTANPSSNNTASVIAAKGQAPQSGKPALQSSRLYVIGQHPVGKTVLTKMNSYLKELNIPERPVATKRVCDLVDSIRRDTQALVALHNQIKRKEKDLLQAKGGSFKSISSSGRGGADGSIGKAIAVKAEKVSKPKAPPRPRQPKPATQTQPASQQQHQPQQHTPSHQNLQNSATVPTALTSSSLAATEIKSERKPSGDLVDLLEVFSPAMDSAMDSAMDLDSGGIIPGLDDAHDHKHPLDLLPAVGSHGSSSVLATVTTIGGEVLLPPPLQSSSSSSQQPSRKRGRSKAG